MLAVPQPNLFLQLRLHRKSRINGVNVFIARPLWPAAIPRRKASLRQTFQKLAAFGGRKVVYAQVNRRAIRLAAQNAVLQMIAFGKRMIAQGLADAVGMDFGFFARRDKRFEGNRRHAVGPLKAAKRQRRRDDDADAPAFPRPDTQKNKKNERNNQRARKPETTHSES